MDLLNSHDRYGQMPKVIHKVLTLKFLIWSKEDVAIINGIIVPHVVVVMVVLVAWFPVEHPELFGINSFKKKCQRYKLH
jgi:hypothetical protein